MTMFCKFTQNEGTYVKMKTWVPQDHPRYPWVPQGTTENVEDTNPRYPGVFWGTLGQSGVRWRTLGGFRAPPANPPAFRRPVPTLHPLGRPPPAYTLATGRVLHLAPEALNIALL